MRILHVCHWDLSSPDAETIRKLALTRELARRGHEVVLMAPDLGRARERLPRRARIVYAPALGGRFSAHFFSLTSLLWVLMTALAFRPEAVYLTDHAASVGVALVLRALGYRFALEVNGIPLQDAKLQGIQNPIWLRLIDVFSRGTWRLADRIAVVSPEIRDAVRGVFPGEVEIVPNGVDLELWRPEAKRVARARLGLEEDRPIVGFLGGFWPWQGVDRLLAAAPLVLAQEPRTLFLLVGYGPGQEPLKVLAREKGIEASVRFPGKVPIEAGPNWVNAFDVGVHLVTPGKSCSPVKLLCYMACARRCVATFGVDGFESVEKDELGRRVDYGDERSIAAGILAELAIARTRTGEEPRVPAAARAGWEGVAETTERLLERVRR